MYNGNGLHEAGVKEEVSHNASEGIEPRNTSLLHEGQGFHFSEAGKEIREKKKVGERIETCRGLSPWRATELLMPEPGRANSILREAADKLNKGEEAVRRIGSRTGSY